MINFRQKQFAAPALLSVGNLLTAGMVGQGFMQMNQASKQAKEAAEQQEQALRQQKRENDKLTEALNNIAKSAPQAAAQAGTLVGQSKLFAVPAGFFGKVKTLGKELIGAVGNGVPKKVRVKSGKTTIDRKTGKLINLHKYENKPVSTGLNLVGKTAIGLATGGALMSGVNYLTNKAITADARNIGMLPPKKNSEIPQQITYSAVPKSVLSKTWGYLKKGGKYAISRENLKGEAMMGAFGALPLIGYVGDRIQYKQQQKVQNNLPSNQLQQKSYARVGSIMKPIKAWWKDNTKNWAGWKTITGGAANLSSFGKYGRREIQAYGKRLQNKNNSVWSQKLGKWVEKNPNKANLVGAGIGSATVGTAFGLGEKAISKATKRLDKDAYAYEESKNQEIPQ